MTVLVLFHSIIGFKFVVTTKPLPTPEVLSVYEIYIYVFVSDVLTLCLVGRFINHNNVTRCYMSHECSSKYTDARMQQQINRNTNCPVIVAKSRKVASATYRSIYSKILSLCIYNVNLIVKVQKWNKKMTVKTKIFAMRKR